MLPWDLTTLCNLRPRRVMMITLSWFYDHDHHLMTKMVPAELDQKFHDSLDDNEQLSANKSKKKVSNNGNANIRAGLARAWWIGAAPIGHSATWPHLPGVGRAESCNVNKTTLLYIILDYILLQSPIINVFMKSFHCNCILSTQTERQKYKHTKCTKLMIQTQNFQNSIGQYWNGGSP